MQNQMVYISEIEDINSNTKIITQKIKYGCHKEYEEDIRVNLINLINNIIINNLQEKIYEINSESAILENSKS